MSVSQPCGICLTFTPHSACEVVIAGKLSKRDVEAGCVSIAGSEPILWCGVPEPSETVEVTASAKVRNLIAQEMGVASHADLDDFHGGRDSLVWAVASRIRTGLRVSQGLDDLAIEGLIWRVYRHVFAVRFGGRLRVKGEGRMDSRRVARVVDYIEAHLTGGPVGVTDLAGIASLSTFHFLRSFARTLHMTPHQFVRARRLERIREAIEKGADPIEIAAMYGFTHKGHFLKEYRRHHGLTPSENVADMLMPLPSKLRGDNCNGLLQTTQS